MSNKLKLYPVEKFSSIREMLALAEKEAPDTYAFKYKPGEKTASGDPVVVSVTPRCMSADITAEFMSPVSAKIPTTGYVFTFRRLPEIMYLFPSTRNCLLPSFSMYSREAEAQWYSALQSSKR